MSQFNTITEAFRDALRAMADKIAADKAGTQPVEIKVDMIEEVVDEGSSAPDGK